MAPLAPQLRFRLHCVECNKLISNDFRITELAQMIKMSNLKTVHFDHLRIFPTELSWGRGNLLLEGKALLICVLVCLDTFKEYWLGSWLGSWLVLTTVLRFEQGKNVPMYWVVHNGTNTVRKPKSFDEGFLYDVNTKMYFFTFFCIWEAWNGSELYSGKARDILLRQSRLVQFWQDLWSLCYLCA